MRLRLDCFARQYRDAPASRSSAFTCRAAVALLVGTLVLAAGAVPTRAATADAVPAIADAERGAAGFLADLRGFLGALVGKGVLSGETSAEIGRGFESLGARNPNVLTQLRDLGAIPEIAETPDLATALTPGALRGTAPRGVVELFGGRTVSEAGVREVFRRIYLPTRADGATYDMFVKEAYAAYIASGRFRNADGSLNREAVADYSQGERAVHSIFESGLERMEGKGTLRAYVQILNHFVAYADAAGVRMRPEQFRRGVARLTGCFEATGDLDPETYVESCGILMRWFGENDGKRTVSVRLHDPGHADRAVVRTLAEWDRSYASKAYGTPFSDVQERANDRFWKEYFQRYLDKGEAIEAGLAAKEMRAVADLTHALVVSMKTISAFASSGKIDGKMPTLDNVRQSVAQARRMKDELETRGSPAIKASEDYKQTMRGFEQVVERARKVGAEWVVSAATFVGAFEICLAENEMVRWVITDIRFPHPNMPEAMWSSYEDRLLDAALEDREQKKPKEADRRSPEYLGGIFPGVPKSTLEALGRTEGFEAFVRLAEDSQRWEAVRARLVAEINAAREQGTDLGRTIGNVVAALTQKKADGAAVRSEIGQWRKEQATETTRRVTEWSTLSKDVDSFDTLIGKHPEVLERLKAKGIDIAAEREREREALKRANPEMPEEEIRVRSSVAVYLRHETEIRSAMPERESRRELDAAFERFRNVARETGIPYQETIRQARDILPTDKTAIIAATSGSRLDTAIIRKGDSIRIEWAGERIAQVWDVKPGRRPEKFVELPHGPRIRIATAPEPDTDNLNRKNRALDELERVTGWEWVRMEKGLDLTRLKFGTDLKASHGDALSAPVTWSAFALEFCRADADGRQRLASQMRTRISEMSNRTVRNRMEELVDDFVTSPDVLGDLNGVLLPEIGRKYERAIESVASESAKVIEEKQETFDQALAQHDGATASERRALDEFRWQVDRSEAVARENLAFLDDNGYSALGEGFDAFLQGLNRNRLSIYPASDADIALPKVLSEKDRALLAHGLVAAIGPGAKVADYFEVPGYSLKRFDESGKPMKDAVQSGLERARILRDGALRISALDAALRGGRV